MNPESRRELSDRSRRTACELVALGAVLAACSGGGGGKDTGTTAPTQPAAPVLTSLSVSLSAATVQVGQADTARAAGLDQRGAPVSIGAPDWTTSSSSVAIVSPSGVVTGVGPGQTIVVASTGGKQGQAAVVVVPVEVATVAVSPSADSASPGETLQLTSATHDFAGNILTGRTVTWSSTATGVATVSAAGLVTAVSAGTAIIVATSEGQSGAAVITVAGVLTGGVIVSIATPIREQVVTDTLPVHAVAYSDYPISAFVAAVGSQQIPLSYVGKGAWGGHMLLTGTLYGTYFVVLTATDANGAIGIDSVEFIRKKLVLGGNGSSPGRKRIVPLVPTRIP